MTDIEGNKKMLFRIGNNVRLSELMGGDEWRERLRIAVVEDGRSYRDISLAAGLSHGYLHGILTTDKSPTLDHLIPILNVLNRSVVEILEGFEIDDRCRELLSLWGTLSEEERTSLYRLLSAGKKNREL